MLKNCHIVNRKVIICVFWFYPLIVIFRKKLCHAATLALGISQKSFCIIIFLLIPIRIICALKSCLLSLAAVGNFIEIELSQLQFRLLPSPPTHPAGKVPNQTQIEVEIGRIWFSLSTTPKLQLVLSLAQFSPSLLGFFLVT